MRLNLDGNATDEVDLQCWQLVNNFIAISCHFDLFHASSSCIVAGLSESDVATLELFHLVVDPAIDAHWQLYGGVARVNEGHWLGDLAVILLGHHDVVELQALHLKYPLAVADAGEHVELAIFSLTLIKGAEPDVRVDILVRIVVEGDNIVLEDMAFFHESHEVHLAM